MAREIPTRRGCAFAQDESWNIFTNSPVSSSNRYRARAHRTNLISLNGKEISRLLLQIFARVCRCTVYIQSGTLRVRTMSLIGVYSGYDRECSQLAF